MNGELGERKGVVDPTLGSSSPSIHNEHQHGELPLVRLALLGLRLDMLFDLSGLILMREQFIDRPLPQLFRQFDCGNESLHNWHRV
jgi:hypothetical protein